MKSTSPSSVYWNEVDSAVNVPMKFEVAVDTRGSSPRISKMGPMSRPPAMPSEPARMPAMYVMSS